MESYLKEFHSDDITNLLNDNSNGSNAAIKVDLNHLVKHHPNFYYDIITNVWEITEQWNRALYEVQKEIAEGNAFLDPNFQIKENCYVRFINLPQNDDYLKGIFPNNDHVGLFVRVKGSVIRMSETRLLEFKREYICTRCKETFILEAKYEKMYIFEIPKGCKNSSGTCKGYLQPKYPNPKPEYCKEYQEIKIQELFSEKHIPSSLHITLENDLTDFCQPGDNVTICGTIERRWGPEIPGRYSKVVISMRAISICKDEEKVVFGKDVSEQILCVRSEWQDAIDKSGELNARDILIQSICPEVYGMHLIKLAIALVLCSGTTQRNLNEVETVRGNSHLLLVGDPGLGKSKLLKAASKIAYRAIHTTGKGCSAAGLTAAAVQEEGEWHLEPGALVLADGGICCIDEFNLMRESDKTSIHEAMEQQTISVAKAGISCTLSSRCTILAATNPRNLYCMSEAEGTSAVNIGIGTPLLSRFDLVFILRDDHDGEFDAKVIQHISNAATNLNLTTDLNPDINSSIKNWDLERLQSHFLAIYDINPKFTPIANEIIGTYYNYCRADSYRDPSRTSVRLLKSLNRLAQSHAKLLFRDYVNSIDAIIVINLMESSWGFGRMIKPLHVLKTEIPLGPNEQEIHEILTILNLRNLEEKVIEELNKMSKIYNSPIIKKSNPKKTPETTSKWSKFQQENSENDYPTSSLNENFCKTPIKRSSVNDNSILNVNELENIFGYHKNVKRLRKSDENKESENEIEQKNNSENNEKLQNNEEHSSSEMSGVFDKLLDIPDFDDDEFEFDLDFDFSKNKNHTTSSCDKIDIQKEKEFKIASSTQIINQEKHSTSKTIFENLHNKNNSKADSSSYSNKYHQKQTTPSKTNRSNNNFKIPTSSFSSTNKEQPTTSKELLTSESPKVKISPKTSNKLAMFKNPNYLEKSIIQYEKNNQIENDCESNSVAAVEQSTKLSSKNNENKEDSAYDTMTTISQSESVNYINLNTLYKLKDEDLSCFELDF